MNQVDHPLQLAEIIHHVGIYLLDWQPVLTNEILLHASRRDILSATQVCRVWHTVLAPLLWTSIDDTRDFYNDYSEDSTLSRTLPIMSCHVRYARLRHGVLSGSCIKSTSIQELSILVSGLIHFRSLVYFNPRLSMLILRSGPPYNTGILDCHWRVLDDLTQLKKVIMADLHIDSTNSLSQFLHKNNDLKELELAQSSLPDDLDSILAKPLASLRSLTLRSRLVQSTTGYPALIRLCPNLQCLRLELQSDSFIECTRDLRAHCPRLRTVEIIRFVFQQETYEEFLERDCPDLVEFSSHTPIFTKILCDALLVHGNYSRLEKIKVAFRTDVDIGIESTIKILTSCPNLRSLCVRNDEKKFSNGRVSIELLDAPWKCVRLENISLVYIVHIGSTNVLDFKDNLRKRTDDTPLKKYLDRTERDYEDRWVGVVPEKEHGDGLFGIKTMAHRLLCEKVWDFPNMKEIHTEAHRYIRRR
ncbi:hypothetical protein BG004_004812 [Podila humilis]|nr:hypothetical protein BG004_004812 [Podila humilis]